MSGCCLGLKAAASNPSIALSVWLVPFPVFIVLISWELRLTLRQSWPWKFWDIENCLRIYIKTASFGVPSIILLLQGSWGLHPELHCVIGAWAPGAFGTGLVFAGVAGQWLPQLSLPVWGLQYVQRRLVRSVASLESQVQCIVSSWDRGAVFQKEG